MLSGWRLMLPIKFIDSPVDLGPCPLAPLSPIRAPGGRAPAPDSLSKKLPNAPGVGQEANLLIIGETIQISLRVGQDISNILLHMRSDMEIVR